MSLVKTITSKRQTDFEVSMNQFLKSVYEKRGVIEEIHYTIAVDGKDVYRSALVMYEEEPVYEN